MQPGDLADARHGLQADCSRCAAPGLHEHGFRGCAVFDRFGAGQRVVQLTFAGRDRQQIPDIAESLFQVFPIMQQLEELLW